MIDFPPLVEGRVDEPEPKPSAVVLRVEKPLGQVQRVLAAVCWPFDDKCRQVAWPRSAVAEEPLGIDFRTNTGPSACGQGPFPPGLVLEEFMPLGIRQPISTEQPRGQFPALGVALFLCGGLDRFGVKRWSRRQQGASRFGLGLRLGHEFIEVANGFLGSLPSGGTPLGQLLRCQR